MATPAETSIHELDFCGQMASAFNLLINGNPEAASPFAEARIEGLGSGTNRRKRKDLRFYDSAGILILCGEVKLPGTPQGRSPYSEELVSDAAAKADSAGTPYFFTWNVNVFVLWDRS